MEVNVSKKKVSHTYLGKKSPWVSNNIIFVSTMPLLKLSFPDFVLLFLFLKVVVVFHYLVHFSLRLNFLLMHGLRKYVAV